MKKTAYFLILALLLIAGCTTTIQKDIDVQRVEEGKEQDSAPVEEKLRTRALRVLPSCYTPGGIFSVTLKVQPLPGTTGVIIEESLPENWKIASSYPQWIKYENKTYKWLVFERELKNFEISYDVSVPDGEKGKKEFRGVVVTHREKTLPIEGETAIKEK
ncbi:MAG TPA: hypothetical protein PKN36_05230 [bacterium]|nr:hypothetical protein [bacterium]